MGNGQNIGDEIIVVGDRVDLVVPAGQVYRAMIEDRIENGPFLIAIPSRKGVPMQVAQEDDIYLVFYRESGRYIAQMKVIALERRNNARYMWLLQKTRAQKNQRREAYRLPVSFSVSIYEYDEDFGKESAGNEDIPEHGEAAAVPGGAAHDEARAVTLETADSRDISVTGIALITRKKYEPEDRYILVMQMEGTPADVRASRTSGRSGGKPPIRLNATVKRCIPWRVSGKFNTGMHFFGMDRNTSEEIARFVLTEQQRQIKMRRLS